MVEAEAGEYIISVTRRVAMGSWARAAATRRWRRKEARRCRRRCPMSRFLVKCKSYKKRRAL